MIIKLSKQDKERLERFRENLKKQLDEYEANRDKRNSEIIEVLKR